MEMIECLSRTADIFLLNSSRVVIGLPLSCEPVAMYCLSDGKTPNRGQTFQTNPEYENK